MLRKSKKVAEQSAHKSLACQQLISNFTNCHWWTGNLLISVLHTPAHLALQTAVNHFQTSPVYLSFTHATMQTGSCHLTLPVLCVTRAEDQHLGHGLRHALIKLLNSQAALWLVALVCWTGLYHWHQPPIAGLMLEAGFHLSTTRMVHARH